MMHGMHSSDAAILGHVFCSFLALILHQALDEKPGRKRKLFEIDAGKLAEKWICDFSSTHSTSARSGGAM